MDSATVQRSAPAVLYAYPPAVIRTVLDASPDVARRLLNDCGTVLALTVDETEPPDPYDFEAWLIERWLKHVRSETFQDTAEYMFLRGEWERSL